MSGSVLTQVSETQRQKATTVNENFTAVQVAALFGRKAPGISGLTWAYFGGMLFVAGVATAIADGTVALTNTATNYVEATTAGVVSANTSAFTAGRIPLYTVTTAGGVITGYTDYRAPNSVGDLTIAGAIAVGNGSAAAPSITFASDTDTGLFRQGANAVGIAGNGVEIARFVGVASATRGFTFTNSNGGNPTIDVTGGGLTITPATTLSAALTYGGVTLSNAVTGTGNMVLSASPTLTGTLIGVAATFSGNITSTASSGTVFQATANTAQGAQQVAISAVGGGLNAFEWGHGNTGGFRSHLGSDGSGGTPWLGFNVEVGTTADTYRTRGIKGSLLKSDLAGGFYFASVDTAAATDNQSASNQVRIIGTASATRYITLTGSNGGDPQIGVSAGNLNITANLYSTGTVYLGNGARIGNESATTNTEFWTASQGAASATIYIGNASINVTSDERYKKNIRPFTDGLALVRQLEPIEFDQDEYRPIGSVGRYVGFSAQRTQKVAPWTVNDQGGGKEPWHLRQEFLMAPLVSAVQMLDVELEALKAWRGRAESALASQGITIH